MASGACVHARSSVAMAFFLYCVCTRDWNVSVYSCIDLPTCGYSCAVRAKVTSGTYGMGAGHLSLRTRKPLQHIKQLCGHSPTTPLLLTRHIWASRLLRRMWTSRTQTRLASNMLQLLSTSLIFAQHARRRLICFDLAPRLRCRNIDLYVMEIDLF